MAYFNTGLNNNIDHVGVITRRTVEINRLEEKKNFIEDVIKRLKTGEIKVQFDFRGKTHIFNPDSEQVKKIIEGYQNEYDEVMYKLNELE